MGADDVGQPLDVIASALRGCLVPEPGKAFVVYDFSQIEARVVAWLAGQTDFSRSMSTAKTPTCTCRTRSEYIPQLRKS